MTCQTKRGESHYEPMSNVGETNDRELVEGTLARHRTLTHCF
jgi:hypothetical protein